MKTISTMVMGMVGISAMIAIAAHSEVNTPPGSGVKSGAVDDAQGNLHVPDGYRTTYQLLGSWAVAADQGQGSKELHIVYALPGTIDAYRKDGHFPDDTVLVKEVYQAATAQMTTGTVSRVDTLKGWFVMVRDRHRPAAVVDAIRHKPIRESSSAGSNRRTRCILASNDVVGMLSVISLAAYGQC